MGTIDELDRLESVHLVQKIAFYYTPESPWPSAAFSRKLSKRKKAKKDEERERERERERRRKKSAEFIGIETAFRAIEHEAGSLYLTV